MNGISIIIPTFNREAFILEAVESVIEQDYKGNLEVIISDDGSTDRTLDLLKKYDDKIIIIRKPIECKSQGVASARNRGIDYATQPFICFLDSDDFYLPRNLKRLAFELEINPQIAFVFCRILEYKADNNKKLFRPWTHNHIFKNDISNPCISRPKIVHTNSFMFRREVFKKVGTFNENFSNGEDIDMWLRISEQYKGKFLSHFGAVYQTQHGNNQLTNNSMNVITACLINVYEDAIQRYYQLGLKDSNRIFELKHTVLYGLYSKNKATYILKYIRLILHYPLAFLRRIPVFFYQRIEDRSRNNWYKLPELLN